MPNQKVGREQEDQRLVRRGPGEQPGSPRPELPTVPAPALVDARLDHPANAGMRTRLLTGLQQRVGNGALQRALARSAARPQGQPDLSSSSGELQPLADGLRFSFRMQAVLDNGDPPAQPRNEASPTAPEAAPEGEEEEEQPVEGHIGPIRVQGAGDRHTLGVINLQERTVPGGVDLQGTMGRCDPQIDANFKVTPIGNKENRNYWLAINATIEYHWNVDAVGRKHIASGDDPQITMENWSQVYYDLMPTGGGIPRSPRRKYWCSDLSVAHELYHRDDFSRAFRRFKSLAEAWLPTQTAATIDAATDKCDEAMRKLVADVQGYMGTGDFAPCEARAYGAGAGAYRERALAVRRRAKFREWPDREVERWQGESQQGPAAPSPGQQGGNSPGGGQQPGGGPKRGGP